MDIKIKRLTKTATIPTYATDGSGCFDLYSDDNHVDIYPGDGEVFSTGIAVSVPKNNVMLIFSRSGHGFKDDVRLSNCVGVIDSDYRGEIKVKLFNDGRLFARHFMCAKKSRIAQALVLPVEKVTFIEVDDLDETERGSGGFGSTGS